MDLQVVHLEEVHVPGPTLDSVFARVDSNSDKAVTRDEIKSTARDAGLGRGLFGGIVVSRVADTFMDTFDADSSGGVKIDEFRAKGATLLPGVDAPTGPQNNPGQLVAEAMRVFDKMDGNANNKLDETEIREFVKNRLEELDISRAETKADISAKLSLHLLDDDGNRHLDRDEVKTLASDIAEAITRDNAGEPVVADASRTNPTGDSDQ